MAQDGSEFVRMVKNDAEWLRLAQNSNSAEWLNIVAPDWFRTDSLTGFVDPSCFPVRARAQGSRCVS